MRKIIVVTSSRADYGLLKSLIGKIQSDPNLELQLCVTGSHLLPEFGNTYQEIENDGFVIRSKLKISSDTDSLSDVSNSIGRGVLGFSKLFAELEGDIVVLLGDRFEIFAAAIAAHVFGLPIAHIHGGESTEGVIDEAFRHSITKMSQLHFVAALEYKERVIQLGENPNNVFLVGGLGAEAISNLDLMDRNLIENKLGLKFGSKNLLVTFHPMTLGEVQPTKDLAELLAAIDELKDTQIIITYPNLDAGGRQILNILKDFATKRSNVHIFASLGQILYLSCVAQVDAVVGNSSSGLTEVPSFKKGTINIGDRQKGRLSSSSVINCVSERNSILGALDILYSDDFQLQLTKSSSSYIPFGASSKICDIIRDINLDNILRKPFYDLPMTSSQDLNPLR